MGIRLWHFEWQQLRRFFTHPVTEILALIAVVLVALVALVASESRILRSPESPVVFSPK